MSTYRVALALLGLFGLLLPAAVSPFGHDPFSTSKKSSSFSSSSWRTRRQGRAPNQVIRIALPASASSGESSGFEDDDIASFRAALEVSLAGVSSEPLQRETNQGLRTWVSQTRLINELNLLQALATTKTMSEEEAAIGDMWR